MIFCSECKHEIERPDAAWRKVEGWEKPRTRGGTNHIALREPKEVFLCDPCMILKQRGLSAQQESLL